jgi:hypothetical protein
MSRVAWACPEDCAALTRLVRKARRDAYEVGRLNAQAEAEGDTEEIIRTNGEDPRGQWPRGFCGRHSVIAACADVSSGSQSRGIRSLAERLDR